MIAYLDNLKKIKLVDKIFNIVKHKECSGQRMFLVAINNDIKQKKIEKISQKLYKVLHEQNIKTVILSNDLMKNEILKKILKMNGIRILDGTTLYKILLPKIIKKICEYKESNIAQEKISILLNENDEVNLNNILELSQYAKSLNIVTNHINKFTKIADYLYEELGILIKVSNNLRKDLLNSDIIINIDFNEDLINKYYINTKAIIINLPENIIIKSKKFAGININSYNIIIPEDYKLIGFDDKYLYESKICYKNIIDIQEILKKDKIKIKNLTGKNGVINKREFLSAKY